MYGIHVNISIYLSKVDIQQWNCSNIGEMQVSHYKKLSVFHKTTLFKEMFFL